MPLLDFFEGFGLFKFDASYSELDFELQYGIKNKTRFLRLFLRHVSISKRIVIGILL